MGIKKDSKCVDGYKYVDDYVLIVDDDAATANLLKIHMNSRGLTARKAANSDEVLEILKTGRPRLAFVDLEIPNTNSYELIAQIKKMYKNSEYSVYICALTAGFTSDVETRLKKARGEGADDAYRKDGFGFIDCVLNNAYYKKR